MVASNGPLLLHVSDPVFVLSIVCAGLVGLIVGAGATVLILRKIFADFKRRELLLQERDTHCWVRTQITAQQVTPTEFE